MKQIFTDPNFPDLPLYPSRFLRWSGLINNTTLKFIEEKSLPQEIEDKLKGELQYHLDEISDIWERTILFSRVRNALALYTIHSKF